VQAHLAWVNVDCDVPGAEIRVQGRYVGTAPIAGATRVVAGDVEIQLDLPGHPSLRKTLTAEAGSRAHMAFVAEPPGDASLPASETPSKIVAVQPVPPQSAPAARRTAGWILLGAGGAGGLMGVAAFMTREREAEIYDGAQCASTAAASRCDRCGVNRDIGSAAQTVAVAVFVSSAAAIAVSGG
jgi:hypothetical protein